MADRKYIIGANAYEAPALEPALYLVATPIGNLGDITLRAIETIAAADVLACEDTRVTRILLDRYGIHQKPIVYQEHNVEEAGRKLLGALQDNRSVALVSDAGMPLVSDPGFRLVAEAREKRGYRRIVSSFPAFFQQSPCKEKRALKNWAQFPLH